MGLADFLPPKKAPIARIGKPTKYENESDSFASKSFPEQGLSLANITVRQHSKLGPRTDAAMILILFLRCGDLPGQAPSPLLLDLIFNARDGSLYRARDVVSMNPLSKDGRGVNPDKSWFHAESKPEVCVFTIDKNLAESAYFQE